MRTVIVGWDTEVVFFDGSKALPGLPYMASGYHPGRTFPICKDIPEKGEWGYDSKYDDYETVVK